MQSADAHTCSDSGLHGQSARWRLWASPWAATLTSECLQGFSPAPATPQAARWHAARLAGPALSAPTLLRLQAPKGKKVAAAPSAVKKAAAPAKPVNPLYEKRTKTFGASLLGAHRCCCPCCCCCCRRQGHLKGQRAPIGAAPTRSRLCKGWAQWCERLPLRYLLYLCCARCRPPPARRHRRRPAAEARHAPLCEVAQVCAHPAAAACAEPAPEGGAPRAAQPALPAACLHAAACLPSNLSVWAMGQQSAAARGPSRRV